MQVFIRVILSKW